MSRALGVALSPDALFAGATSTSALFPSAALIPSAPLIPSAARDLTGLAGPIPSLGLTDSVGWTNLAPALAEIHQALAPRATTLHVALLPPLVQLRRIELPRLTEDEARAVLARDAYRHLVEPPRTPVVALWSHATRRSTIAWLAAFADADLVASIHVAAAQAGFREARVVSAHAAWEAAVRHHVPETRVGRGRLVVSGEGWAEALAFDTGRLQLRRRAASPSQAALLGADANPFDGDTDSPDWIGVVASDDERPRIEATLQPRGLSSLSAFADRPSLRTSAALAVAGAALSRAGELVPEPVRLARWRGQARLSRRLLAGAATMLLLSALVELWGSHRELAALESERREIRPLVAHAMELRETMTGVEQRLRALASAEAETSRWTGVIATVAERLPSDAHLLSLRAERDSVVLEGVAARAAGAFESLRAAPGVSGVRAEAPIRQEAQDSAAPVERFSLGARLAAGRAVESRQ